MNAVLNRVINEQCGFITEADKAELMPDFSQLQVLIRTGCNRYLCALADVEKVFALVEEKGDYVRDVGLTAENYKRIKHGQLWSGCLPGAIKQVHPDM
jgi:hypothetical protein